jgi:hypothetical protein
LNEKQHEIQRFISALRQHGMWRDAVESLENGATRDRTADLLHAMRSKRQTFLDSAELQIRVYSLFAEVKVSENRDNATVNIPAAKRMRYSAIP